ncbi:Ankyrin repeat domain-containing protein 17 [Geodia barretti]|nr:Ankyrin repeat domain-containing protein 17 [Geodia barretti]
MGLVNALLRYSADVDATAKNGYTALLQACTNHYWYLAQVLIGEGADVNKCTSEGIGPLFVAVEANEYDTASLLIRKGASVNVAKFEAGAVDGIIELTPLAQAAQHGFKMMVELLLDSGADINYLCSNMLPAIAYAIIGDHVETFHLLLNSRNSIKTLHWLTAVIMTSVRTEKYYYTRELLDILGGPRAAVMQAQRDSTEPVESIVMYMQAVNHPDLAMVLQDLEDGVPQAKPSPVHSQPVLSPRERDKINSVLTSFCRICVSAIFNSSDIKVTPQSLIEIARATDANVANVLYQALSGSMTDQELRHKFLQGEPSPLRYLIAHKILTIDIFQIEVLKFHPNDSDSYLEDLVWTFHNMSGGAHLPRDVQTMLNNLFTGGFTPRTTPQGEMYDGDHGFRVQPQVQRQTSEPLSDASSRKTNFLRTTSLNDPPLNVNETESNSTLPGEERNTFGRVQENVENSITGQSQRNIPDKARIKKMKSFQVTGINVKLGGFASYCDIQTSRAIPPGKKIAQISQIASCIQLEFCWAKVLTVMYWKSHTGANIMQLKSIECFMTTAYFNLFVASMKSWHEFAIRTSCLTTTYVD